MVGPMQVPGLVVALADSYGISLYYPSQVVSNLVVDSVVIMSRIPPRKGLLSVRAPKITGPARRTVPSGNRGPAAKGGDEGYLYLAGVRDASKRITEYSVSHLSRSY